MVVVVVVIFVKTIMNLLFAQRKNVYKQPSFLVRAFVYYIHLDIHVNIFKTILARYFSRLNDLIFTIKRYVGAFIILYFTFAIKF